MPSRGGGAEHYDVLIIGSGSGFGGSVTALRLSGKGYRVGVLEAGRRFADHELPETSWRAKDYLFAPALGLLGIQRLGRTTRRGRRRFTADQLVFAAAALGTQRLLHSLRDSGSLPHVSPRLGELSRTNSEAGLAVRSRTDDVDYSEGVAITSSIHLDESTHVEPCRYGHGSNTMGLARRRRVGRGRVMTTRQGIGEPNPSYIPEANDVGRRVAAAMGGIPGAGWTEMFDIPTTGHFLGGCPLGGCPLGETHETGVVDPYHRLHGHPGLHVIDGSTVAANLGVNPSLTICAMAERAVSLWPNKGEEDPRPATGYRRLAAIEPHAPVVPPHATGALRAPVDLPIPARRTS